MLFILSTILGGIVLFGVIVQCLPIYLMSRRIANSRFQELKDEQYPPAAIMLSLRGGDPFLSDCLQRLTEQDYPDYHLFIALDNENDPANHYLQELIDKHHPKNLTVRIITERPEKCTLVNHNYSIMVSELDPRFEIIAFVDADAVTSPQWLKSLVQPLVLDPEVGGTSGNRWYTPDKLSVGTLTRTFWNMGSLVQMALFHYPWGGSMAMRADVAKSEPMIKRWKSTFTGDTPSYTAVRELGKKYVFNPNVILLNREDTSLGSFLNWMPRQMLNGRLYHPNWMPVVFQAIASSILLIAALAVNITNIVVQQWAAFGVLTSSLMFFWITIFLLFLHMDRTILTKRGGEKWLSFSGTCWLFLVVPLVQFVYFYGILKALAIRDVTWRGIDYVIESPFNVRLVEYKPFDQGGVVDQNQSL